MTFNIKAFLTDLHAVLEKHGATLDVDIDINPTADLNNVYYAFQVLTPTEGENFWLNPDSTSLTAQDIKTLLDGMTS